MNMNEDNQFPSHVLVIAHELLKEPVKHVQYFGSAQWRGSTSSSWLCPQRYLCIGQHGQQVGRRAAATTLQEG